MAARRTEDPVNRKELRRRIAVTVYRTLYWGRNHLPAGIRSLVGVCLIIGGFFGFLPILGFWMLPVGVAFIALDVPQTRHRIDAWMLRLALEGKLDRPARTPTPPAVAPQRRPDEPPPSDQ
jgi:hypothetical protein